MQETLQLRKEKEQPDLQKTGCERLVFNKTKRGSVSWTKPMVQFHILQSVGLAVYFEIAVATLKENNTYTS